MNTDKEYWHGYISVYQRLVLPHISKISRILEFGVLRGDSIRWLHEQRPMATIVGVDVTPQSPEWPVDKNIQYVNCDQGDRDRVRALYQSVYPLELVIDDGSHQALHQAICLEEGWPKLLSGGFHVIEDIHTNLDRPEATPLKILLAVDHVRRLGDFSQIHKIATRQSYFPVSFVIELLTSIDWMYLYKRTSLPLKCWKCNSTDFDYSSWKCICGENLMAENDSMSFIIRKK